MGFFRSNKKAVNLRDANRDVNAALHQAKRQERKKIKLLLLGAGESGKSTIFKQMRILYNYKPVTDEERRKQTQAVYSNVIMGTKAMIKAAATLGREQEIQDREAVDLMLDIPENARIDTNVGNAISSLWNDPVFAAVWEKRSRFQLPDSLGYFMSSIDRIADINYLATTTDFLQVRVRTTGVLTATYTISDIPFEMYDVGGQRNERRKWIHCFEEVNAVIFVAALSEYDQALFEDHYTNRMMEALDLFEEVCSMKYFKRTSIILFFEQVRSIPSQGPLWKSPHRRHCGAGEVGGCSRRDNPLQRLYWRR